MNRTTLGLAVGAGYLLGRTKKLKMALAVGSLVAGKKLNLGPGALAALARQQLSDNPQFKEIGDQLRQDLRGVGKAASGAMVGRQMGALADRLHDRTARMRDELSGAQPAPGSDEEADDSAENSDREAPEDDDRRERGDGPPARKAAKKAQPKKAAEKRAPAKKAPAKKAAPGKKAAKSTGTARKTAAKKTFGARGAGAAKGGDER
ncbi:DNA primase [Streptomyces sp. NPDC046931]|uniref:DNA primase n=1 Tax=Streptomyces sp. NPDC046931 TaxID=3154806 RepID=UPI003405BC3F